MGKNRRYRATPVKNIKVEQLGELGPKVIVGIDVAKRDQFVAFGSADGGPVVLGKWKHPTETQEFYGKCKALRDNGQEVTVVMEPSGTYGDPLVHWFQNEGFEVRRVLGKQVHDGAAALDGVVSGHDAKAATLLVELHRLRGSREWSPRSEECRTLRALVDEYTLHDEQCGRLRGMAEGLLARHWPELGQLMRPRSKVYWSLLEEFGGPRRMAEEPETATRFMVRVGGPFLKKAKVESIIETACGTLGMPMQPAEERWLQRVASSYRACATQREAVRKELEGVVREHADDRLVALLGVGAVATLLAYNLDPLAFPNANAFVKALGLCLKEHSSGQHKGRLSITKRGAPRARWMMVLAALRLIITDPVVKAWHIKKRRRDGMKPGERNGLISTIAVTRKVAQAAWHVARGNDFDASKLYDVSRLQVTAADSASGELSPADEDSLIEQSEALATVEDEAGEAGREEQQEDANNGGRFDERRRPTSNAGASDERLYVLRREVDAESCRADGCGEASAEYGGT